MVDAVSLLSERIANRGLSPFARQLDPVGQAQWDRSLRVPQGSADAAADAAGLHDPRAAAALLETGVLTRRWASR